MADIKAHQFFRAIEWEALEARQVTPPYRPPVSSERDLTHFDPQFTKEEPRLSPDDANTIAKLDQSEFDGWEYVNPLLLAPEQSV